MNIYNYAAQTGEFIKHDVADKSPLEAGIHLIPALATTIEPPATAENEAAVFDEENHLWRVVADYRSVLLWDKSTAGKVTAKIGQALADLNATPVEPTIDYPKWDESSTSWVTDEGAQLSAITSSASVEIEKLLITATNKISPLQDAVDLGIATETENASLTKWKTFRVAVNRVTTQPGFPTTIDWPTMPE